MRLTINKDQFLKALNSVGHAIAPKSPNPVLSNIKLDLNEKGLELTGSNAELAIKATVPYMIGETEIIRNAIEGQTLVNAHFVTEYVRRMEGNEVTIEIVDDSVAKIGNGQRSVANLKCANAEEYPDIDFSISGQSFEASCIDVALLVEQSAFAASTKEQRPVLAAVNLECSGDGTLVATATDSARLACKTIRVNSDAKFRCNVPAKILTDIVRLFEGEKTVSIAIDDHKALFSFGNTIVTSRLIPGDYPATKAIIPTNFNYYLEVNAQELLSAMGRVSILSTEKDSAVKLSMSEDEVEVYSKSDSNGSANEGIQTFSFAGERLSVSFNPAFVIEAIRALKSEDVTLCFQAEMKPFVVKNVNDPSVVELITPMRTY